jgi:hypothetical protein
VENFYTKIDNGDFDMGYIKPATYIKQEPQITDDGIYMPEREYVLEGTCSAYRMIMTKEMFIEAYNKWIKIKEE